MHYVLGNSFISYLFLCGVLANSLVFTKYSRFDCYTKWQNGILKFEVLMLSTENATHLTLRVFYFMILPV